MSSIVVMKFGSSVLADEARVSSVIDEIYRAIRAGYRVVAVVSALGDTTDALVGAYGDSSFSEEGYATYVGTGELQSAALLTRELGRAGIASTLADATRARLVTDGSILNAEPVGLDTLGLIRLLEAQDVVVVPGFLGRDIHGRTTLLGRGGSDLSAVFIANRLDAPCILLKDVDGIFEEDPALSEVPVPKFERLSWQTALEIGGAIVQRKALEFAAQNETTIVVRSLGGSGTLVGSFGDVLEPVSGRDDLRPIRVGLIGLGTVGDEVYRRLTACPDLEVVSILVRDLSKPRNGLAEGITNDPEFFFASDLELVVDCSNPSQELNRDLLRAVGAGLRVVTANKGNLADSLSDWGQAIKDGRVRHSASVGGVVTMLETVRQQASASNVQSFRAVLNGTCNFILDRLHQGESFDSSLAEAQALGFAEADPSADIDGWDAARKCALLALEAWGTIVDWRDIDVSGIRHLTREEAAEAQASGATLRLVAEGAIVDEEPRLSVKPQWVAQGSPEAKVKGGNNVLTIHGARGRILERRGAGAGGLATAVSVFGDVLAFVKEIRVAPSRFMPILIQDGYDESDLKARQSHRRRRNQARSLS